MLTELIRSENQHQFAPRIWRMLVQQAGCLKIDEQRLSQCSDLVELKRVVRKQYLTLAKQVHPDMSRTRPPDMVRQHISRIRRFKTLTRAYMWFQQLTQEKYDRAILARQRVAEATLPIDFGGWDSGYDGYQVGHW